MGVTWWFNVLLIVVRIEVEDREIIRNVVMLVKLFGWIARKYANRINRPPM